MKLSNKKNQLARQKQSNCKMYNVLKTGSKGNSVIYHKCIMVDCGAPYSLISQFVNDLQIVLLTHVHTDHINLNTLKKMQQERPSLRVGCCKWMLGKLDGVNNIDVYEIGKLYNYEAFQVSPIKLFHDVPNCGYRIFKDNTKIIHCTDTCTLEGISAKDYDLYAIEHNYNEDTIMGIIEKSEAEGKYTHLRGSINSHLSEQQARDFIYKNRKESSKVLRLHESTTAL